MIMDPRTGELVEEVVVQTTEPQEYPAEVIGFDPATDIAVLKIRQITNYHLLLLQTATFYKLGMLYLQLGIRLGLE